MFIKVKHKVKQSYTRLPRNFKYLVGAEVTVHGQSILVHQTLVRTPYWPTPSTNESAPNYFICGCR